MKPILYVLGIMMCLNLPVHGQISKRSSDFVTPENRARFEQYLIDTTIGLAIKQPADKLVESQWKSAFWAMELIQYRQDSLVRKLRNILQRQERYSESFRRALLEAIYALYPTQFETEMVRMVQTETNAKRFAMGVAYLQRRTSNAAQLRALQDLIVQRFPSYQQDAILWSAYRALALKPGNKPSFQTLQKYLTGKSVVYSFQRPNRDYAGLAIVQDSTGKLVTDQQGNLLSFEQFGRSASNLPYYLTNGNTPQGIFAIVDTATSDNAFIGPTPNLQSRLPYEASLAQFSFGRDSSQWSLLKYHQLFPADWQIPAMEEAFYAGKAGRSEIIAHGTCIDPSYYRQDVFYPFTPSMGCLTGKEIWNSDGSLQFSAQLDLINVWLQAGSKTGGYLVVIELADVKKTIQIDEVNAFVKK
jgi:hypothetical protein